MTNDLVLHERGSIFSVVDILEWRVPQYDCASAWISDISVSRLLLLDFQLERRSSVS